MRDTHQCWLSSTEIELTKKEFAFVANVGYEYSGSIGENRTDSTARDLGRLATQKIRFSTTASSRVTCKNSMIRADEQRGNKIRSLESAIKFGLDAVTLITNLFIHIIRKS
ncbi:hypothetical protein ACT691_05325 [Vibrio metschnikovii]